MFMTSSAVIVGGRGRSQKFKPFRVREKFMMKKFKKRFKRFIRKENPNWVKRNLPEVSGGAGLAAGGAAVPTIVTAAGGGASCAGITGGLAALGGGTMLGGLVAVAAIPMACGAVCLGVGYVVKRLLCG